MIATANPTQPSIEVAIIAEAMLRPLTSRAGDGGESNAARGPSRLADLSAPGA